MLPNFKILKKPTHNNKSLDPTIRPNSSNHYITKTKKNTKTPKTQINHSNWQYDQIEKIITSPKKKWRKPTEKLNHHRNDVLEPCTRKKAIQTLSFRWRSAIDYRHGKRSKAIFPRPWSRAPAALRVDHESNAGQRKHFTLRHDNSQTVEKHCLAWRCCQLSARVHFLARTFVRAFNSFAGLSLDLGFGCCVLF